MRSLRQKLADLPAASPGAQRREPVRTTSARPATEPGVAPDALIPPEQRHELERTTLLDETALPAAPPGLRNERARAVPATPKPTLDELRAAKAHLEAHGYTKLRLTDHRVSQSIYLDDPDGNMVELFVDADPAIWAANPAAVAQSRPLALG